MDYQVCVFLYLTFFVNIYVHLFSYVPSVSTSYSEGQLFRRSSIPRVLVSARVRDEVRMRDMVKTKDMVRS